jgi:hypothetical protein
MVPPLLKKHPVPGFFLLAFALSWILWIPLMYGTPSDPARRLPPGVQPELQRGGNGPWAFAGGGDTASRRAVAVFWVLAITLVLRYTLRPQARAVADAAASQP